MGGALQGQQRAQLVLRGRHDAQRMGGRLEDLTSTQSVESTALTIADMVFAGQAKGQRAGFGIICGTKSKKVKLC